MNHTLSFTTPVGFNYATVITDISSIESAIDNANKLIWVKDLDNALKAFDDAGLDSDDIKVVERPKSEYAELAARLAAEAQAAALAEKTAANDDGDEASDDYS